jgi:hypothetical protein
LKNEKTLTKLSCRIYFFVISERDFYETSKENLDA